MTVQIVLKSGKRRRDVVIETGEPVKCCDLRILPMECMRPVLFILSNMELKIKIPTYYVRI